MQLSHNAKKMSAAFDDANLVASAGLVPVLGLAARCDLAGLVTDTVSVPSPNVAAKTVTVVAGMVAGADSIDDLDRLRHGAMGRLFTGIRAPSTLGTFLRLFTFGHVCQLQKVLRLLLVRLATHTPLLQGAEQLCWVDVDDTVKQVYGYKKQGVGYGYTKVKGLNALVAALSTPVSAPVIAATRLRKGQTASPRGAPGFVAAAISTARACGATGLIVLRADAGFYSGAVVAAARRAGARFSITAPQTPSVRDSIATIDDAAWTTIHYTNAIWDDQAGGWISDAEVAETTHTAFIRGKKQFQVTARLIVRRVKRLNQPDQDALVEAYRYHAILTDSPQPMIEAEANHRRHAIVEQVMADLKQGPLNHLPSGRFPANAAWLTLAGIALNLTRAAGCLASAYHATARPATIRDHLINIPARIASSARQIRLHLPTGWRWEQPWLNLATSLT